MKNWKTRSRKVIFTSGRFLTVEMHSVELPSGEVVDDWPWIITPDYVNILPITTEGEFICFRQEKYGIPKPCLAAVGGYLEAGEDPLKAAKRELLEETGMRAGRWVSLGKYQIDGNRGNGTAHLYLALDARPEAEINADDLEEQELLILNREEIETALMAGEFMVLPWTTAVALGLRHLDREEDRGSRL